MLTKEDRRAALGAEDAFMLLKSAEGWEVHRNGWPDFLCVVDGQSIAVEVKSGRGGLSKKQSEMMSILASSGISCYVWHPDCGLTLYQEGRKPKNPMPRVYRAPQDKYPKAFSESAVEEHRRVTSRGLTGPRDPS